MSLPDLPPEWGTIIVPDDASALAREAAEVRRQLRRERRRSSRSLTVSIVVMTVAVLVTMVSLVAVTWGRTAAPAASSTWSTGRPRSGSDPAAAALTLAEVQLRGASGEPIPIGTLVPAVVILVEGCACGTLLEELAASLPTTVKLVAVAPEAPCLTLDNLRCLADPTGELTARYPAAEAARPTAIAVSRLGESTPLAGVATTADLTPLLSFLSV